MFRESRRVDRELPLIAAFVMSSDHQPGVVPPSDRPARQIEALARALRESEGHYRIVFDSAPLPMSLADLDGRIIVANAAYTRMLGYEPDELAGKSFVEVTHPEDVDAD